MAYSRRTSQDVTNTSSGASLTITFPATATAGDLLVVFVQQNGTVSFSALLSGWVQATGSPLAFDAGAAVLASFYKISDGTETKFTATSSGTGAWQITSLAFTGAQNPVSVDVAFSGKDGGTTASTPATTNAVSTTLGADLVLIAAATTANNGTWTWASPAAVTATSTTRLSVAQHIPAALLTSQSYSATLAGTRLWGTAVIAFKATPITASASGSISMSQTASAGVKVSATASGSIKLTGAATVIVKVPASAAGVMRLSGTSTAGVVVATSATGALRLSGTSTAGVRVTATAVGSMALTGSATVTVVVPASAAGSLRLSASASAGVRVTATATGSMALAGAAAAVVRVPSSASGSMAMGATGSVVVRVPASASGAIRLSGTGVGVVVLRTSATGSMALAGVATGTVRQPASAAGSMAMSGLASATFILGVLAEPGTVGGTMTGGSADGMMAREPASGGDTTAMVGGGMVRSRLA